MKDREYKDAWQELKETRVERTGLVLRQTMLDFEKGRMKND